MASTSHEYEFSGFLADVRYIEELKPSWSWSSHDELDEHLCQYFIDVHGQYDIDYAEWRYRKWKAVMVYVSRNAHAFNFGDLSVVGEETALSRGKLFHPIFDYAIAHDITKVEDFPEPGFFHKPAA
jgi:hypothetical protein